MKNETVGVVAAMLAATGTAGAQQTIPSAAERPTSIGSAEYFTGQVMVEPIFGASEHRNVSAAMVTFQPGARSAWHTHPIGQTIVVVASAGPRRTAARSK
jgi:quercetin dioxygenase-like cupin family protein